MQDLLLSVKDLRISFQTFAGKLQAIRGVNFDLYQGETLAIVGESGSGKTVTVRSIMGLLSKNALVESGEIVFQDEDLLKKSTYSRWQKKGTLYGISRYSMVALMESNWFSKNILAMHMRTIYSRMFELVIIQRASMLRFSSEVTKVSSLKGQKTKDIAERVNSLYKEYIRFINHHSHCVADQFSM